MRSARLTAWGGRLRRGISAGRRALPAPRPLAAAVAGVALAGTGVAWYHGRVNGVARGGGLSVLAQVRDQPFAPTRPSSSLLRLPAVERGGRGRAAPAPLPESRPGTAVEAPRQGPVPLAGRGPRRARPRASRPSTGVRPLRGEPRGSRTDPESPRRKFGTSCVGMSHYTLPRSPSLLGDVVPRSAVGVPPYSTQTYLC